MNRLNSKKTRIGALFAAACAVKAATDTKLLFSPDPQLKSVFCFTNGQVDHTLPQKNASGINENRQIYEREVLPPELSRNVLSLTCDSSAEGGVCHVYLVGTVHRSPKSCQLVEDVIKFVKPEVVFLELSPTQGAYLLHRIIPKAVCGEIRVAFDEARKYGSMVVFGDRPYLITYGRIWAKMPPSFEQTLQNEDFKKMVKQLEEVGEFEEDKISLMNQKFDELNPSFFEILMREHDQYMSASLLKIAREHNSVVAVVGMGHLPGIRNNWEQPINVEQLLEMPATIGDVLTRVQTCLAGVGIISGILFITKMARRIK